MRFLALLCLTSAMWAADRANDAAARGIALIQAAQKAWTPGCESCHHQFLPPLAFQSAREHGIPVNEDLARASATRAFATLADLDRAVQYSYVIDPALSDGNMLLGGEAAGVRHSLTTAIYARLIAARQRPDGHWDTFDVRPPQSYSKVTATVIAARAIEIFGHPSLAADTKARLDRARSWLAAVQTHAAEERAMQLFGLIWTHGDPAVVRKLAAAIEAAQQPDGGWSPLDHRPSDVYSTGEAMVALAQADPSLVHGKAWQRGVEFLVRAQAPDGSWHVPSRIRKPAPVSPDYFESGYPYGHDQFISIMGATWAIRALALSLPQAGSLQPLTVPAVEPAGAEAWIETAIFGSTAELSKLLDQGLDPNSATKSGGTTLLMMVQPDLEKTNLLVTRGAKVNLRSKTHYSALMVAAQYRDSAPSMQFLLDHGAEVRLAKGERRPLFNASPLVLAASAGNVAILPKLVAAGADVEAGMLLQGQVPSTAMFGAVSFGDVADVRAMLDCGAKIDRVDSDGITALGWAAIGNSAAIARLLIERGADVNHVDKLGMTPLLYAASIDFGDSSVIDLLLKSGANPAARTKEGLTAADLARKYGHTQVIQILAELRY